MMSWTTRTDPSGWQTRWSDEFATKWRTEGHWTEPTLRDFARDRCAEDPGKVMLIEGDNQLTRGACRDQALRLAAWFIARGLKPGDVISFQLPNWNEVAVIALAARMTGLVINPIPPIYRESELAYILADCGSKLIFVPGMFRKCDHTALIDGLRSQLPLLKDVVVVRNEGPLRFEHIITGAPAAESDLPAIDPAAVIIAMYTSGTTGRPKCVLHTHYTYGHRVNAMAVAYGMSEADVTFMPSPVTHITGAIWAFDMPWVAGNTSVLMDVWSPEEGIACIEQHGCTVSGGATPFLQQMLDIAEVAPQRLRSMRLFFCGGTTVSPELIQRAAKMVPQALFYRAYGSTECLTATLGHSDRKDAWLGAETDGCIVYPVEMRIVDAATMAELPEGAEGEIYLRAPGLFVGYLNSADNEGISSPMASSRWAISAAGCIPTISSSPGVRKTSSSDRAKTSAPRKSKMRSMDTRRSPKSPLSPCQTPRPARSVALSSSPDPARLSTCQMSCAFSTKSASPGRSFRNTWFWSTTCRACRRARFARMCCEPRRSGLRKRAEAP